MARMIVLGWFNDDHTSPAYGAPRSAVWRNVGTSYELRRARKYAAEMRYTVFVFPANEPAPLHKARELIKAR